MVSSKKYYVYTFLIDKTLNNKNILCIIKKYNFNNKNLLQMKNINILENPKVYLNIINKLDNPEKKIKKISDDVYILFILYNESLKSLKSLKNKDINKNINVIKILNKYLNIFYMNFIDILIKFNIMYNKDFDEDFYLLIDIEKIENIEILNNYICDQQHHHNNVIFIIRLLYLYNTTSYFDFYIDKLYKYWNGKSNYSYEYINNLLHDFNLDIYELLDELHLYKYRVNYTKTGGYYYFQQTILKNLKLI